MSLPKRISKRLNLTLNKTLYARTTRGILSTKPLAAGDLPFMALSMVHKRDVLSYLVAIKSFAMHANPQRVVIVCDPSIGDAERHIFKQHIPHVELRRAEEFRHVAIPQGGCWERLSAISQYAPENYVVQLDADTVTVGAVPEVVSAIRGEHGFVLAEEPEQRIVTLEETAERARPWVSPTVHIQGLAEALMVEAGLNQPLYVRGCAGFTGFPKTATMQAELFDFSVKMREKTNSRWSDWGTEQVASNFLVANAPGTTTLPFPMYGTPNKADDHTAFLHFIGSMRFINRMYETVSGKIVGTLRSR
ncbi:MAG: hypothetical protein ACM3SV_14045 [Betaproteobacteria bacterium]